MVFRRVSFLLIACVAVLAMLSDGTAFAQTDADSDEEAEAEIVSYGDAELIEMLRTYDLLDDWLAASPVSPQASLLRVTSNGSYQTQRRAFLDSIEAWANRTELLREEVARIDAAQADSDALRSVVTQVYDALVLDDRLASESATLVQITAALDQLAAIEIPEHLSGHLEDALTLAEVELNELRELAESEITPLNGAKPAETSSGVEAFVRVDELRNGLDSVDRQIERGRGLIRPAREESERLVSFALSQLPALHAARLGQPTDVGGLSVVTVDAYVRAAERSTCSVDWAMLAGIGRVESNHGRIGGASVSGSGQVSTTILGPLLDGGASEAEGDESNQLPVRLRVAVAETVDVTQLAVRAAFQRTQWHLSRFGGRDSDLASLDAGFERSGGNGFAIVFDSDDGLLDGNEDWDRAIGPMQFLPETWSRWATDGNGDGRSDPHNLYDATASAARFLCDLSTKLGSSPSSFILGYNASGSYVREVLSSAQTLRSRPLPAP